MEEVQACVEYGKLNKLSPPLSPELIESIKEWSEEFPLEYRTEMRKEFLKTEIDRVREIFFARCKLYAARTDDLTHWSDMYLDSLHKRLYKLDFEAKAMVGKKEGITQETIARARQYPLIDLVKARGGMTPCIFHTDKHPSMDIRKNYYYCYSCGQTGDVIDFVMKKENLTFEQAITRLSI